MNDRLSGQPRLIAVLVLGLCLSALHAAPADPKAVGSALDSALERKSVADLASWLAHCGSNNAIPDDEKNVYGDTLADVICDSDFTSRPGAAELLKSAGINWSLPLGRRGATLLQSAVSRDKMDVTAWLLDNGADVNARGFAGSTAALSAVFALPPDAQAEWIRFLVRRGININARDDNGCTALNDLASDDDLYPALVALVENGADFNIGDNEGIAPLSNATQHEAVKNKAYLKAHGARLYSYKLPVNNDAPPCKAVLSGDLGAIASLPLKDFSAMVGRTAMLVPETALHLAAERGSMSVLKALCARKVDWDVPDRYGRSPLQLAIMAGRADAAALLLDNGADPNRDCAYISPYRPGKHSSTPFLAAFQQPAIAMQMLKRGLVPRGEGVAEAAVYTENLELVKALGSKIEWSENALEIAADTGQVEILDFLAGRVSAKSSTVKYQYKDVALPQLLEMARTNRARNEQNEKRSSAPLEAPRRTGGISLQRGTFPYVVESWSPWLNRDATSIGTQIKKDVKLEDYPVGVYVPKAYDGKKPYGLVVSMTNAKSSSRYPRDFTPTLDRHDLIWVGFDPYNGLDGDNNLAFCLAIVYNMLGYYNIDRSRIYIGGFSFGGQHTEDALKHYPWVFTGAFFINIGYDLGPSCDPEPYYIKHHIPIVYVEGDYDYNRLGAYWGYDDLVWAGYQAVYYFHEPMKGHILISADSFERTIGLLDAAKKR
jgi:hypothetical protein